MANATLNGLEMPSQTEIAFQLGLAVMKAQLTRRDRHSDMLTRYVRHSKPGSVAQPI